MEKRGGREEEVEGSYNEQIVMDCQRARRGQTHGATELGM